MNAGVAQQGTAARLIIGLVSQDREGSNPSPGSTFLLAGVAKVGMAAELLIRRLPSLGGSNPSSGTLPLTKVYA